MKLFVTVAAVLAVLIVLLGYAGAQDKGETTPVKPDLPLEKPLPEETEEPEEEEAPGEGETPPNEEQEPPEEEGPENPPTEFFEEPIETAEVIFVIDRTGSMRWPSKMSVVDEGGNPVNNAAKYDVARIELVKAITAPTAAASCWASRRTSSSRLSATRRAAAQARAEIPSGPTAEEGR